MVHLQVSFLLEVYGQLEEPDGLSGLVQLRQGGLTTSDQILVAEKAGSWADALAMYEHELGREAAAAAAGGGHGRGGGGAGGALVATGGGSGNHPGGGGGGGGGCGGGGGGVSALQLGRLRCLLQVGHLQALLQQVDGLLARQPPPPPLGAPATSASAVAASARAQLAAVGVAAAWRLGSWGLLREYLDVAEAGGGGSAAGAQEQLDLCVGRLLLALQQDRSVCQRWGDAGVVHPA